MPGSKLRLITILFVFIGATVFFWLTINGFLVRTRAVVESIPFFFESENLTTTADKSVPVNIFFRSTKESKVSAATIQLKYSALNMTFDESMKDQTDVTCQNNDFSLTTLINVSHNQTAGTVSITRGLLNSDDTALPPHLDSGISCFGTVYFKPKTDLSSYPVEGVVSFNADANVCEVVGPNGKTYTCDLLQGKNLVSILIEKPLPTPTPIISGPTPTPSCKTGVKEFSVEEPCTGGFRQSSYVCFDGTTNTEGGPTSCKTPETWRIYAQNYCTGKSSCLPISPTISIKPTGPNCPSAILCNPPPLGCTNVNIRYDANGCQLDCGKLVCTLTPTPICTPRPACLDSEPICLIPEPATGWCPTTTPPATCLNKSRGDCNCDGIIDITDFEPWRQEFTREIRSLKCDYNRDNKSSIIDFNIWRVNYFLEQQGRVKPTGIFVQ